MENETTEETEVVEPSSTEQDPLKTELDKVQGQKRTKEEKLLYSKKRIEEQLEELGVKEEIDEDEKPVTLGMLKQIQAQTATKTALQLADATPSETERELLKYHLENTIRSTGNPNEDFRLAQSLVNSVKNSQIIEETIRKPIAKPSSGGGAPANVEKQAEFTSNELAFMKPPFNMTKEQILQARK